MTKRRGFNLKSTFHIVFKAYKDKKAEHLGKNPQNYVQERNETCKFEQKPVDIDVLNEEEEKIVKEMVEKLKIRRREVTGKNKLLDKKEVEQGKKAKGKCGTG